MEPLYPDRLRALADLTERLRRGDPPLLASLMGALGESPLHPHTVRTLAMGFGQGWSAGRLAGLARALSRGVEPVGTVAVVAPGNLFVAAWQAVLEPWLAGNRVRVRPSADDRGAVAWLVAQLTAVTPAIEIDPWPRDDVQAGQRFFAAADAVALWGGDLALTELRQLAAAAGFGGPLRLHGPRAALAIVDTSVAITQRALAGLARDVVLGDGRGCMGLGQVWWLDGNVERAADLHERLAVQLQRAARRWPPGPASTAAAVARQQRAESLAVAARVMPGAQISARPDGWLLTAPDRAFASASGQAPGRCAVATTVVPDELPGALLAVTSAISVVVTNLPADAARDLARGLRCRWCRPGQAQAPRADHGHDGYGVFEGFVRQTSGRRAGA